MTKLKRTEYITAMGLIIFFFVILPIFVKLYCDYCYWLWGK